MLLTNLFNQYINNNFQKNNDKKLPDQKANTIISFKNVTNNYKNIKAKVNTHQIKPVIKPISSIQSNKNNTPNTIKPVNKLNTVTNNNEHASVKKTLYHHIPLKENPKENTPKPQEPIKPKTPNKSTIVDDSWSKGDKLLELLKKQYETMDLDSIFGEITTCDLTSIF